MPIAMARAQPVRDRVHHPLPQTRGDQDHQHQTGEHDHAHRVRPAHLGGELQRDDGVDAQAGGDGDRDVADDTHQDACSDRPSARSR